MMTINLDESVHNVVVVGSHRARTIAAASCPRQLAIEAMGAATRAAEALYVRMEVDKTIRDRNGLGKLGTALEDLLPPVDTDRRIANANYPQHVAYGLAPPVAQRLTRAADLLGDGENRGPLRGVLVLKLEDHSHGPLPNLGGL